MSNCLIFAVWRWIRRGGYLVIRRSRYGWWPHLLWSQDLLYFEEYQPCTPNSHLLVPPPIYRGFIKFTIPKDGIV